MKIALIILPIPFLRNQKRNAPLGILYVAAALERAGYSVSVTDLREVDRSEWLKKLPEADVYGISATSMAYNLAVDLARQIKEKREAIIVLGGVHATIVDPSSIDRVFDSVVQGEGELAILQLVSDVQKDELKRCYSFTPTHDIDSIPFPARHLLPYDSIVNTQIVERGQPATTIITSRGCPYNCTFCANERLWGRRVRFHSPDYVVEEIKLVMDQYHLRQFRFHDDTMTVNKPRLRELSRKLKSLDIKWRCHGRVDTADIETLTLLKEAGCDEIGYGIETASQAALDLCRKGITVEQSIQAIKNTKKVGLKVRLYFVIGLPGDFGDLSGRMIEFIKATKPDGVDLSTLSPFPGSEIYENPSKFGMRLRTKDFSKYRLIFGLDDDEYKEDFVFEYDEMSNEELKYHRKKLLDFTRAHNLEANR